MGEDTEEKPYLLRMPSHIRKRAEEMSKKDGRSLNAEINYAVIEYLRKQGYDLDMVEDRTDKSQAPTSLLSDPHQATQEDKRLDFSEPQKESAG